MALATAVNLTTAVKMQILFKAQIGLGGLKAVSKKPDLQQFLSFPLPLQAIHCTSDRSQCADSATGSRFLHQCGDTFQLWMCSQQPKELSHFRTEQNFCRVKSFATNAVIGCKRQQFLMTPSNSLNGLIFPQSYPRIYLFDENDPCHHRTTQNHSTSTEGEANVKVACP